MSTQHGQPESGGSRFRERSGADRRKDICLEEYRERQRILGCRRADLLYDREGAGDGTHKNGKPVSFIFVYKIAALKHFIFCWKILSTVY